MQGVNSDWQAFEPQELCACAGGAASASTPSASMPETAAATNVERKRELNDFIGLPPKGSNCAPLFFFVNGRELPAEGYDPAQ